MVNIQEQEDQSVRDYTTTQDLLEGVYELAFGEDAINKEYSNEEVLAKIREFSDKALRFDEMSNG